MECFAACKFGWNKKPMSVFQNLLQQRSRSNKMKNCKNERYERKKKTTRVKKEMRTWRRRITWNRANICDVVCTKYVTKNAIQQTQTFVVLVKQNKKTTTTVKRELPSCSAVLLSHLSHSAIHQTCARIRPIEMAKFCTWAHQELYPL